jgi:hypothetical protein
MIMNEKDVKYMAQIKFNPLTKNNIEDIKPIKGFWVNGQWFDQTHINYATRYSYKGKLYATIDEADKVRKEDYQNTKERAATLLKNLGVPVEGTAFDNFVKLLLGSNYGQYLYEALKGHYEPEI